MPLILPNTTQATIRREGTDVLLFVNGNLVLRAPWQQAEQLAAGIRAKAKEAEEEAKAPQIAADQAVLMRAGFRIGLTDRPDIKSEAMKEAMWDPQLRRFIHREPTESDARVGTPGLRRGS